MRVALTGGSGVVGGALLRHLIGAGHHVRALARTQDTKQALEAAGAEPVRGDVLDGDSLEQLVSGCEWVFHVAGVNELCPQDPANLWRVNVDGSTVVLEACARVGVRRLIHTSSAVTLGEATDTVGNEWSAHRGHFLSEYERSKAVAERLVLHNTRGVDVVSVNPSSVQGPGRSSGTGAIFRAMAQGKLPVLVDATISLVDIDDCARGHILAAERGITGERYVLSGPTLTMREATLLASQVVGRKVRPWFVRPEAVSALAPVVSATFRALGSHSPLCPESARVLLSGHRYDGSRATRDLGLEYRPLRETLERTVEWFQESNLM